FEVALAGMARDFDRRTLKAEFGNNFHVCYRSVFEQQKDDLVLVKGDSGSRLFQKACCISEEGRDRTGRARPAFPVLCASSWIGCRN
ncbi:MAG TPA: hypothetical protein VN648_35000, partial [Candidatus Methylomirabilis sp.]|nr:hypothetical protein [Candidatus Methylomirabilis sp.]